MIVELAAGASMLIDECEISALRGRSPYLGSNGYAYVSFWPTGPATVHSLLLPGSSHASHIDHINGNKLDNRRANLRVVTPQANQVNRKRLSRANTSGARGVTRTNASRLNPWRAQITVAGRNIHLGLFPSLELATEARRAAELEHFGQECPR